MAPTTAICALLLSFALGTSSLPFPPSFASPTRFAGSNARLLRRDATLYQVITDPFPDKSDIGLPTQGLQVDAVPIGTADGEGGRTTWREEIKGTVTATRLNGGPTTATVDIGGALTIKTMLDAPRR